MSVDVPEGYIPPPERMAFTSYKEEVRFLSQYYHFAWKSSVTPLGKLTCFPIAVAFLSIVIICVTISWGCKATINANLWKRFFWNEDWMKNEQN